MTIEAMERDMEMDMVKELFLTFLFSILTMIYTISAIASLLPLFFEKGLELSLSIECVYILLFMVSAFDRKVFYEKYEYFLLLPVLVMIFTIGMVTFARLY